MELLYYINITEEYQSYLESRKVCVQENFDQNFLYQLGKVVGEIGIEAADLKVFKDSYRMCDEIFLAFKNPEDAMAFKIAWTSE